MKTNKIEVLYQKAAEIIQKLIPVSWLKVYLYAEVSDDSRQVYFYFYPEGSLIPIYSLEIIKKYHMEEKEYEDLEDELYDVFTELWDEFERQKQEKWTNLTFTLENSGEFAIDYNYNDLAEVNSYNQLIIWKYERLGIMPEENKELDLKIIQDYKRNVNNSSK